MKTLLMRIYFFILIIGSITVQAAGIDARVAQELATTGQAKVIIALNVPDSAPNRLRMSRAAVSRDPIGDTQETVLNDLPTGSYELTYQYSHVPGLAMTVTPESFEILKDHPQVKYIQFDELEHIALAEAVPLINADDVHNGVPAYNGSGVTVAVLDSGINTLHDYFASKIQVQHCTLSSGCPATGNVAEDGNGHGSHVSGIVTKVAPGAKIAAVKVCNDSGDCQLSDTIAGLNWVTANHLANAIKVVNMSIASTKSLYSDSCDEQDPLRKAAIDSLIDEDIVVFAASGNEKNKQKMGAPACLSNTIAVGATYDNTYSPTSLVCTKTVTNANTVACFSNSSPWLDILAPGSEITSSWKGSSSATKTEAGTSMATPMASGVAALMLQKNTTLIPAQIKAKLKKTGVSVIDTAAGANNIARPRIDALAAVNDASTTQPIIEMLSNGSYLINQGKLDFGWTITGESVIKTITIKNSGTDILNLGSITIPSGFILLSSPPTTLNAGGQQSFQIQLSTTTTGSYSGTLQFSTNDTLANPMQLDITGRVCTLRSVPFSEDFEGGAIPDCWRVTDNNLNLQPNWGVFNLGNVLTPISNTYSVGVESNDPVADNDDWLILPRITVANKSVLQFNTRNEAKNEKFELRLSTTGNNPNDFTNLLATEIVTATVHPDSSVDLPNHYSYSLNSYAGQNVYLAIRSISPKANSSTLVIDDVSITVDNSPPSFNSTPTADNPTTIGFDLTVRLDEMGNAYYVVLLASNSNTPSNTQVKSGQDGTGTTTNVKASGFDVTAASTDFSKTISGLISGTAYKVYVVAEDTSSNLQATPTSISATTTTTPVIPPPVVTPTPPSYTVIERKDGTGTGQITSIYIGQSTWTAMAALSAIPDPGSVFVKWTGNTHSQDCYSDQPTVYVRLNAIKTCTATFDKITADNQSLVPVKLAAYYLPGRENSGKALIRITNTNATPVEVKGTLYHASGQLLGIANSVLIPTLAPQATVELSTIDLAKLCSAPAWTGLAWLHLTTPTGLKLLNLLENDNQMISNFSTTANDNTLYNLPASTSAEQANIVLINTSDKIQPVTATLYADSGQILGKANTVLANVAARGIFTLSIKQLELLVDTVPWTDHVAKLQITSPLTEIKVMATLLSNDATVLNLTPTHQNAAFNVPGATNLDQAFVYVSNDTNSPVQVKATLYHQDGYLLGNPETILVNSLAPQATYLFSVNELEKIFNVPTWQKRARLMITSPTTGIKVMTLIRNSSGVSNISAVTTQQAFYLPNATDADKAYVRMTNLTNVPVTVTGVAYAENGQVLGSGMLTQLAAQTTTAMSIPLLETALKITGWNGKMRLMISPAELQIMGTVRSSTGQLVDMSDVINE